MTEIKKVVNYFDVFFQKTLQDVLQGNQKINSEWKYFKGLFDKDPLDCLRIQTYLEILNKSIAGQISSANKYSQNPSNFQPKTSINTGLQTPLPVPNPTKNASNRQNACNIEKLTIGSGLSDYQFQDNPSCSSSDQKNPIILPSDVSLLSSTAVGPSTLLTHESNPQTKSQNVEINNHYSTDNNSNIQGQLPNPTSYPPTNNLMGGFSLSKFKMPINFTDTIANQATTSENNSMETFTPVNIIQNTTNVNNNNGNNITENGVSGSNFNKSPNQLNDNFVGIQINPMCNAPQPPHPKILERKRFHHNTVYLSNSSNNNENSFFPSSFSKEAAKKSDQPDSNSRLNNNALQQVTNTLENEKQNDYFDQETLKRKTQNILDLFETNNTCFENMLKIDPFSMRVPFPPIAPAPATTTNCYSIPEEIPQSEESLVRKFQNRCRTKNDASSTTKMLNRTSLDWGQSDLKFQTLQPKNLNEINVSLNSNSSNNILASANFGSFLSNNLNGIGSGANNNSNLPGSLTPNTNSIGISRSGNSLIHSRGRSDYSLNDLKGLQLNNNINNNSIFNTITPSGVVGGSGQIMNNNTITNNNNNNSTNSTNNSISTFNYFPQ